MMKRTPFRPLALICSVAAFATLLVSTGAAAQVFEMQVLKELAHPINLGSRTPPQGIPNLLATQKVIDAWAKGQNGCKPGGEFEKISRFTTPQIIRLWRKPRASAAVISGAEACAELMSKGDAVKNFLGASASGVINAKLVAIAAKLGDFRKNGWLNEESYRYFMEIESSIEKEKKEIAPLFEAVKMPFPERLAKDIKEIQGMFLKSLEVWSTAKATAASTIKSDRALLALESKCVAKDLSFGTMVNGKWEKVKGKVTAAKYLEGDWTIVTDAFKRPVSRWKLYTSIIQVPGEKFCRKTIAVAGSNHFHSQKYIGGKFEKVGGVACELGDFWPVSCK